MRRRAPYAGRVWRTRSALALALLAMACVAPARAGVDTNQHVLVISIDGLRPVFYLPNEGSTNPICPTLVALQEKGSYAKRALSVYPSLTYPAHAAIATGVTPARHGVTGNSLFEPVTEKDGRGFWYAADLKSPALWDIVSQAGGTVGAVSWPCSAGSSAITWNLPEFWSSPYGHELTLTRRYASDGLVPWLEGATAPLTLQALLDDETRDAFLTASACEILCEKRPTLLLVHLASSDHQQHLRGPSSPRIPGVMTRLDTHVRALVSAVRDAGLADRTTIIVLGDHGFADVQAQIAPNALLARNGFITISNGMPRAWTAMVMNSGGSAGVYVNRTAPTGTTEAVHALLAANAVTPDGTNLYSIIERDALTKLGGPAPAAFYLEAQPGYMFTISSKGSALVRSSSLSGNHGYLPTRPEMATGFLISGRGIKPGVALDSISITDVAPTIAALLGIDFPGVEGRVLKDVLAKPKVCAPKP